MTHLLASLPMYDWPELSDSHEYFWQVFSTKLETVGIELPHLDSSIGEGDWLNPELMFSQTCGYPFATQLLGKVKLVATPHYNVEGCDGPNYSSAVIVSANSSFQTLEDARSALFTFNGRNSLSGYRCLWPLIGNPERHFPRMVESGGHRNSARMVAEGQADIAAVDSVCWHHFQSFDPDHASKLRVLCWSEPLPALPFITSVQTPDAILGELFDKLQETIHDCAVHELAAKLRLLDISSLKETDYQPLSRFQ